MMRYLFSYTLLFALVEYVVADGHNPISAPKALSVVQSEKPYVIRWTPGTPGPVRIDLHFAESSAVSINASIPNNGSYIWTPSGVFNDKDNYFLSICDNGITDCTYTFNGRFAIESSLSSSSSLSRSATSTTFISSSSLLISSLSTSTATSSSSSSITTASGSSSPSPTPRSGLSSGAKIALGVVLGLVGLIVILIGILCLLRTRKRREPIRESYMKELSAEDVRNELSAQDMRRELNAGDMRRELSAEDMRNELSAEQPEKKKKKGLSEGHPWERNELPG